MVSAVRNRKQHAVRWDTKDENEIRNELPGVIVAAYSVVVACLLMLVSERLLRKGESQESGGFIAVLA